MFDQRGRSYTMRALIVGFLVLLVVQLSAQCTIQSNTNYNTAGDLVTLYKVASTQDCCAACQTFEECSFFSYTKDPSSPNYQQCVIKSSSAAPVAGTTASVDSGSFTNSYSRPTACSQQDANTDYFLKTNLGSASSSSPSDCCGKCSQVVGCNYWTLSSGTCWFKANMGQKKSSPGITSGTVIPASVASTPKRTGKKGLGVYGTSSCSDLEKLTGVAWVYNWAETPGILEECYDRLGIQYIPMAWGPNTNFDIIYGNAPYLLTFNEPNFGEQSNMSPSQAAGMWAQVQAVAAKYNMLIGSPSASYGGATDPIQWLDQFFAACVGCKVDFINTHQYDCNYYGLYGAISNFYKYGKPVWVTEFSCYGQTVQDDVTFVNGILPLFDNDVDITHYAFFGARSAGGANMDVFDSTKSALTPVGVAYNGEAAPTSAPTPTQAPTSKPNPPTQPPTSPTQPPPPPTQPPTSPTQPPTSPTQPPTSPTQLPANGFLQSKSNNLYVTLDSSKNLAAIASSTATAIYFKINASSGGNITLQNGIFYVSSENGGNSPLDATRYTASAWENYIPKQTQPGYWAFLAVNDKYVAVQASQGNELQPTSASIADAALFRVTIPVPPTSSVSITTATRVKFFSVGAGAWINVDNYNNWVAAAGDPSVAVAWNVGHNAGYTLQNAGNSLYTSADGGGTGSVVANRQSASGWETFSFVQSGSTYAILASANNQLVALQSSGQFEPTVANSGTIPNSALFYVVSA